MKKKFGFRVLDVFFVFLSTKQAKMDGNGTKPKHFKQD